MNELREKLQEFLGLECRLLIDDWIEVYTPNFFPLMKIKIHQVRGKWLPMSAGLSVELIEQFADFQLVLRTIR